MIRKCVFVTLPNLRTFTVLVALTATAWAGEQVIYSFPASGAEGFGPRAGVVYFSGNLYGVASLGGGTSCNGNGCGAVFELSPTRSGGWNYRILYAFQEGGDAQFPFGRVAFDSAGNLYGTTLGGGANGLGAIYKLAPRAGGQWTESVIYSFHGGEDGEGPYAGVTVDASGNLYGTTPDGGANGLGVAYQLSPNADGSWTETVLHAFGGINDAIKPFSELVFDATGNLYGTTPGGGTSGRGTVYELSPNAGGWTETVVYSFARGADMGTPDGPVWVDSTGNLFGVCSGAPGKKGSIFELTKNPDGTWSETKLHTFGILNKGFCPEGGVTADSAGNLYGTTYLGGSQGFGVVYRLKHQADGTWTYSAIYSFTVFDGQTLAGVTLVNGNLFGTTYAGVHNDGEVYEITH